MHSLCCVAYHVLCIFYLAAHENNFHCIAKVIDRIAVALCTNNGDNIEQRLREFLVVSFTYLCAIEVVLPARSEIRY